MTPRLYLPHSAYAHGSLSWRILQGVVALVCCASIGAGVACLSFIR